MNNIETKWDGEILTITIDTSKRFGRSKSGKTIIVATSAGNQTLTSPSGKSVTIGLNAYVKD